MMGAEKTLSLTQPWATLVVIGAKRFETRSWGTRYRGPLLIHASKNFPKDCQRLTTQVEFYDTVAKLARYKHINGYPCGAIIGRVVLLNCYRTEDVVDEITDQEDRFGDFGPGRYAWQFIQAEEFECPIPAKGSLGIWVWNSDVDKA